MAPQVASLSELSRIRGDAEVRYPYAITEPRLFSSRIRQRPRDGGRGGDWGGQKDEGFLEGRRGFFLRGREEQRKEREREKDIKGKRRDRPQQGDELLVKWLLLSSRASQLPFFGSSFSFPQSDIKHKPGEDCVCKQFWARSEVIGRILTGRLSFTVKCHFWAIVLCCNTQYTLLLIYTYPQTLRLNGQKTSAREVVWHPNESFLVIHWG